VNDFCSAVYDRRFYSAGLEPVRQKPTVKDRRYRCRIIRIVNDAYLYALKLLRARDHSVAMLRQKLEGKFGEKSEEVIQQLLRKNFLNDRRFAENYVARRRTRGRAALQEELKSRGVASELIREVLAGTDWPSLSDATAATMKGLKLRAPLQSRDAARLFRALLRLGYEEDAIREQIENLRET
jgi:SOS response regulatory protein OraA/RecX